jgi:anti-sigma regulatory factor (Ser/Thr protein kinase)
MSHVLPDLLIAVSEAAANAILHSGTEEFRVSWRSTQDRVRITVEDDGIFVDRVPVPEIDGVAHRGISLMAATMDELSLTEGRRDRPGTRV